MADWEEKLPPIMRERLAAIGEATPEEKERIRDSEQLSTLLSQYYKGELTPDGLRKELKAYKTKNKSHLLKEAQLNLIDSLSLGSAKPEFQKRRDAILAIEALKKEPSMAIIERTLHSIEIMQKRYREEFEQAYNSLKEQVERNPQLRFQQVRQGQNTMVVQLSVDEAIRNIPEWNNFVTNHERRYGHEFAKAIEKLKNELK